MAKSGFSVPKAVVITITGIILTALVIILLICAGCAYMIVHPEKETIDRFPDELGLYAEFHEISVPSGAIMASWFIPSQPENTADMNEVSDTVTSDRTVIFSHSYKDNRTMTALNILYFARDLACAGYNVVLFDYSGSGSSTGTGYTFGTRETDELKCVMDYFQQKKGLEKFALAGWSFGAAAALMAGADDSRVQVIVADSPYADLRSVFSSDFSRWSGMPDIFTPLIRFGTELFAGIDIYRDTPLSACRRMSGKSVLLISGQEDDVFGSDAQKLYSAVTPENVKEIWTLDCGHMAAWLTEETNYKNKVIRILDQAYGIVEE